MKRFSEQLYKKAQTVKLKKAEQADLRERIVSYMEYHPLPIEMRTPAAAVTKKTTTVQTPVATEPFAQYNIPFAQIFKFGGAFAAIMLVVIPVMAERAVPGDTLYAVKVNINEEVRSTLTLDPYQKVEWETTLINRRIAEAKLLKKEGRLTEFAEAEAAAAVKQHANNAKAEIATLRESDADEAAIAEIALDSTLTVQAHSFATVDGDLPSSSTLPGTDLIANAIDESLVKPTNQATTSLPALPKLVARVEQNTTRLRELETSLSSQVEASVAVDVARRIGDIERVAAEAFALPEASQTEAQMILVDVLARAQRLIVFMTDLGVRETVAIETVVPVVLTQDEQNRIRSERMTQIEAYISQLATAEPKDVAVAEKIAAISERIAELRAELATINEYASFVSVSDEALALGADALLLIEQADAEIVMPDVSEVATSTATTSDEAVIETGASTTEAVPVEELVTEESVATTTEETSVIDETESASSTEDGTQETLDASIQ